MNYEVGKNTVTVSEGTTLTGRIEGVGNVVTIDKTFPGSRLEIFISGNGNRVEVGKDARCKGLKIQIGNHVPAHKCDVQIGTGFSSEPGTVFFIYNSGNKLEIGNDCMFSRDINLRTGESPHLIFDTETGDYLDESGHVIIGDHVWIGEGSYITKKVTLPSNTIVAAHSVVTRKFAAQFCAVGGNPARVIRENVRWMRNIGSLKEGTPEHESFHAHKNKFINHLG